MLNKRLAVLFLATFIGISGCSHKQTPTYYLSDAQKAFSNFKEGSYWIMKDSITGESDSLLVAQIATRIVSEPTTEGYANVEERTIDIAEINTTTGQTNDTISYQIIFFGTGSQLFYMSNKKNGSGASLPFKLVFANFNVGINGTTYDSVSIAEENIPSSRNFKLFINPESVLLKIHYQDIFNKNVVRELIRAKINK